MRIDAKFEDIFTRYPSEMKEILLALQQSKSKHRNTSRLEDLTWAYEVSVDIEPLSFHQVLSTIGAPKEKPTTTWVCMLSGKIGRRSDCVNINIEPPEVTMFRVESEKHQLEAKEKAEKMSDEERQQEISKLLEQLGRGSGFLSIKAN